MSMRRTLRALAVAASLATLTALSLATAVMACTGGGDFPVLS
jgi:hypothetical protein